MCGAGFTPAPWLLPSPMSRPTPLALVAALLCAFVSPAPALARPAISVRAGADGQLTYTPDAAGNRVIDFSHAGYGGGGEPIPSVPAVISVSASTLPPLDDRARIQRLYLLAANRPAEPDATASALAFLDDCTTALSAGPQPHPNPRAEAWTQLCHALLGSNAFLFLE